jgi:hypothetical protein
MAAGIYASGQGGQSLAAYMSGNDFLTSGSGGDGGSGGSSLGTPGSNGSDGSSMDTNF